jgi:hypothetical protein
MTTEGNKLGHISMEGRGKAKHIVLIKIKDWWNMIM